MLETDYYEKLIEKYFLNNNHSSLVVVVPVKGMTVKKDNELKEKLAKIKESMSVEEIQELINRTKRLKEYQETPSTKEELDTIPVLKREDLSKEVEPFSNILEEVNDVTIVRHDYFTNGISYFNLCFDVTDIPKEMLPYLVILKGILGYSDTLNYSYSELSNEIGIHTGGIYQEINIYRNVKDYSKYNVKFEIKGKSFFFFFEKTLELVEEIIFNTKLDDTKRMYEIICEGKSNLQGILLRSADAAATIRNLSYISDVAVVNDCLKGIEYYKFVEKLESNFEKEKDKLVETLKKLVKYVFRKDNLVISYTANEEGYAGFKESVGKIIDRLSENDCNKDEFSGIENNIVPVNKNEGFKTSSQVQYVTRVGDFSKKGYEYNGALKVLKRILASNYLWKNIREQGGAYGCSCVFAKSGEVTFTSYRDPNLSRTNEVFEKTVEFVEKFDCDERDMTKYIIGTISGMDMPLTAVSKGSRSMSAYFNEDSVENLLKDRLEVLEANQEQIRGFAGLVNAVFEDNNICVIGNEGIIEKEKELFKETVNLFE